MRPNRSLNRTLHSVPAFVQAKTLAQIPSRCSGPVSFDVGPRRSAIAVLDDRGGMSAPVAPCLDITELNSVVLGGHVAVP